MCYNSPGPRCAGHTRTLFRQTKEALIVANANFEAAKNNLSDADDLQAQAALMDSEQILKLAQANHADATEKYDASKAERAEKMEDFRKAKDAYCESAEGIQALRDAGKTDEAEKYSAIREMKMEELKRVEATKAEVANSAIKAVIEKPATVPTAATASSISPERYKELKKMTADDSRSYGRAYDAACADDCPADLLTKMANNSQWPVRHNVAKNHNTPLAVLNKLSTDVYPGVRQQVAGNKNADASLLKVLASDESGEVRGSVAINENAHPSTLSSLAADENEGVRQYVAFNKNCPSQTLEALSKDTSRDVRSAVAKHANTPVSTMRNFKETGGIAMVRNLAYNRALPADMQQEFVNKHDDQIDRILAGNTGVDEKVLREIYARNSDEHFMYDVVANKSTPVSLISEFVGTHKDDITMKMPLQMAAYGDRISVGDLELLSKSKFGQVVGEVARNPRTPKHVLQGLVNKPSKRPAFKNVAKHAAETLAKLG